MLITKYIWVNCVLIFLDELFYGITKMTPWKTIISRHYYYYNLLNQSTVHHNNRVLWWQSMLQNFLDWTFFLFNLTKMLLTYKLWRLNIYIDGTINIYDILRVFSIINVERKISKWRPRKMMEKNLLRGKLLVPSIQTKWRMYPFIRNGAQNACRKVNEVRLRYLI